MTLLSATPAEIKRFMSFVEILPSGCWFWTGARSRGKGNKKWYSTFWWNTEKGSVRGHRFSCEQIKGIALPPDHHRDHLCRFSLCVNPDHVDIIPKEENQRRSRLEHPPVTLHYQYVDGQLELSLKIRTNDWQLTFTPAENKPILSTQLVDGDDDGTIWHQIPL